MLGNLSTDMTKQGVTIVAKGNCAACDNPIVGQVHHPCSLLHPHEILQNSCFVLNFCGKVNICYDRGRSSQRWVGSGIRSTSCVSSANRSSARATSSSIAARRTASAITTCCTHRAASTATAPSLT